MTLWVLAAVLAASGAKEPLVDVRAAMPEAVIELRYATEANFMKAKVYPETARCLLLSTVVQKLKAVEAALKPQGFRLKFYDCYRPLSVQRELWQRFPKRGYVANPKGGSHHNRGAAVDVTLVTKEGAEVEMPTPFDTFSPASHQGAVKNVSLTAQGHRDLLRRAMEAVGMKAIRMEWWHYELPDAAKFPLRDEPF